MRSNHSLDSFLAMDSTQPGDDVHEALPLRMRTQDTATTSEHIDDDRWSVAAQNTRSDQVNYSESHVLYNQFSPRPPEPRGLNEAEPWNPLQTFVECHGQHSPRDAQLTQSVMAAKSSLYYSAQSGSHSIFFSAASGFGETSNKRMQSLRKVSEYEAILRTAGVGPIDSKLEQDWSGRGQHAQFHTDEVNIINELLPIQDTLGKGNSAVVHSVKCRRILLARKTIYTDRRFTMRQAVLEVAHLTRFNHAHVVRLIGTYTWQKELSILIYPATEYNLSSFLESLPREARHRAAEPWPDFMLSCGNFFPCLSSALHHIHQNLTKHMDIKPQNILVRVRVTDTWPGGLSAYRAKVYISDFGIARNYQTSEAINTDGTTSFTRKYAAPEVVQQDFRGLPADIFSMGCVFAEIFTTLYTPRYWFLYGNGDMDKELKKLLSPSVDSSYQNHIDSIRKFFQSWSDKLDQNSTINTALADLIVRMLSRDPAERPTALDLVEHLPSLPCCSTGPDEL